MAFIGRERDVGFLGKFIDGRNECSVLPTKDRAPFGRIHVEASVSMSKNSN
jgi:hypothetical protein